MNIDAIYARARAAFAPPRPNLIQHDNVDIELSSTWSPPAAAPGVRDLPIYPAPVDLQIEATP